MNGGGAERVDGAGDAGAGVRAADKADATAAAIAAGWRRLAGGEAVVAACSGGGDSSALVLALAGAGAAVVVAHVVHDLRPEAEALADRDAAADLAARLGLVFAERRVMVRGRGGNAEAAARRARYAALAEMARERGVRFIATGHQSEDQLETVLMRVLRGSGPAGLGGIAPKRRVDGARPAVWVVRPMLGVRAAAARGLCRRCNWAWREDASNGDLTRLRNGVRLRVVPALLAIEPEAGERAGRLAAGSRAVRRWLEREAAGLEAAGVLRGDGARVWARAVLAASPAVVVGAMLRRAFARGGGGHGCGEPCHQAGVGGGVDRLSARMVGEVVAAARGTARRGRSGGGGATRRWDWPGGVVVEVDGGELTMRW